MTEKSQQSTRLLHRFFSGIMEQTFQGDLGVADPQLIDYLSNLLIRFVKFDAICQVRALDDEPVTEISQMLVEAEERIGLARRDVYQHIGDFTLFWAGLFPESLKDRRGRANLDRFGRYCTHGKESYRIASEMDILDDEKYAKAPSDVLGTLSDDFELCAHGLRQVRYEWENPSDDAPRDLLLN